MLIEPLTEALTYVGVIIVGIGGFFEIIGALGILRMPYFVLRAHAATMTVVGGTVAPLIGVALTSIGVAGWDGLYLTMMCIAVAVLILITAPTGTHVLVKASITTGSSKNKRMEEPGGGK